MCEPYKSEHGTGPDKAQLGLSARPLSPGLKMEWVQVGHMGEVFMCPVLLACLDWVSPEKTGFVRVHISSGRHALVTPFFFQMGPGQPLPAMYSPLVTLF